MVKVALIGHFGFGKITHNGQTVKTKIVGDELKRCFGDGNVLYADTQGGFSFLLKMPSVLFCMLRRAENILIMPAYKGLITMAPLLLLLNMTKHRGLHYVVIGGWLPEYLKKHFILWQVLRHFDGIYVETGSMKDSLQQMKFSNVQVMPNFKNLSITAESLLPRTFSEPLKLCTFSRVSEDKGIAEAAAAVTEANNRLGREAYRLDIYGKIDNPDWFEGFLAGQPSYVSYGGVVEYSESVRVLGDYYLLLFLTFYKGEGFAGTVIDAMAAGLPILASDWHSNAEIIRDGETGFVVPTHSVESVCRILVDLAEHHETLYEMRVNCVRKAAVYAPSAVIGILTSKFK